MVGVMVGFMMGIKCVKVELLSKFRYLTELIWSGGRDGDYGGL